MSTLRPLAVLAALSSPSLLHAQRDQVPMPPATEDATLLCPPALADQGAPGNCIAASSVPMLGMLYPLGTDFWIDSIGNVGIGTTTPLERLQIEGSAVATGEMRATLLLSAGSVIAAYGDESNATYRFGVGAENTGLSSPVEETLAFITSGAERMRITDDGQLAVGTVVPFFNTQAQVNSSRLIGLRVEQFAAGTPGTAIQGIGVGTGVFGQASTDYAIRGLMLGSGFGVFSQGDFGGTGAKYFIQPHPQDASKEIRFVCLEGNESGTYFRGSSRLRGGRAIIEVPEEFRLVTESDGLTVQLTPVGAPIPLWIESKDLETVVVRGEKDVEFDYFVNGVRRGFADIELIHENRSFVPEERDVAYGTQYPEALRRILVENGTLNPDFTPNETTARRNGWELREPRDEASRSKSSRRRP